MLHRFVIEAGRTEGRGPRECGERETRPVGYTVTRLDQYATLSQVYTCTLHCHKTIPVGYTVTSLYLYATLSQDYTCRLHCHKSIPVRYTVTSRSWLTVPLSRNSVGTYPETSSHATFQGTFGHSRLSLLSHCGFILE